jgi:hypothetical protein
MEGISAVSQLPDHNSSIDWFGAPGPPRNERMKAMIPNDDQPLDDNIR